MRVIVPDSLLGLAKLISDVLPVGLDLSNGDDREEKSTVFGSVPGGHDDFVDVSGLVVVEGGGCVWIGMGKVGCGGAKVKTGK